MQTIRGEQESRGKEKKRAQRNGLERNRRERNRTEQNGMERNGILTRIAPYRARIGPVSEGLFDGPLFLCPTSSASGPVRQMTFGVHGLDTAVLYWVEKKNKHLVYIPHVSSFVLILLLRIAYRSDFFLVLNPYWRMSLLFCTY